MNEKESINHKAAKLSKPGCSWMAFVFSWLGIFLVMTPLCLVGLGAVMIVADPIEPVDAVVVLSGDDGNRLQTAIEMQEKGLVNALVITDTSSVTSSRLEQEAKNAGFPPEAIYITAIKVESTVDEAIAVRELALQEDWDALMIVTDPFHSFRTRIIFRQALGEGGIQVYVRPVTGHWFTSTRWFLRAEGWQQMFLEIIKTFNYALFKR
jgi:uncharacterized SAM-binding protein YcdF (DUF218 family)